MNPTSLLFTHEATNSPVSEEQRRAILEDPGFGKYFTDHMARVHWSESEGWHTADIEPYGPLHLDPATSVLHYAQEIFEGMKAYRHSDGSVWLFRPERNAARMQRSAQRIALPQIPEDIFIHAIEELIQVDSEWVPGGGETSLYLRPFMIGTEPFLGVRSSKTAEFIVIASPAGPYFKDGVKPIDIWLSTEYSRAGKGGTGYAKCGGNYASSLIATQVAHANGCSQVAFLDAETHSFVEELGGMNLFFVDDKGDLHTPPTSGTILEGITRDSLITLARDKGITVHERPIHIDEWREGVGDGHFTEVFACGTAAVVTPVGNLVEEDARYSTPTSDLGPVASALREELLDIQYGRTKDTRGWMRKVL